MGDDLVGHANDRRGVHTATEFGEDWAIRTQSALDGFREDRAKVLLVFGIGAVPNPLGRIEIPILIYDMFCWADEDERGRWYLIDPYVKVLSAPP